MMIHDDIDLIKFVYLWLETLCMDLHREDTFESRILHIYANFNIVMFTEFDFSIKETVIRYFLPYEDPLEVPLY